MNEKISTWQVLRNKFPANEYVLMEEVSDKSGFSRSRSLDYMLVNLWESRGLAITGIEEKSYRSDWLRELKNPKKQEEHFKYCDYFYLLTVGTTPTIVLPEEIPISWGWMQINEKGVLKVIKQAPKLQSTPVDRSLLCAMLRRAASKENYVHKSTIEDRIKQEAEAVQEREERSVRNKLRDYDDLKKKVDEFVAATGLTDLSDWAKNPTRWHHNTPKELGEAVQFLLRHDFDEYKKNLEGLGKSAERIHGYISESLKQLNGQEGK